MKIVHINNVAGVAATIAQYQRTKGHNVTVYSIYYADNPMNQSLLGDINTQYNKKRPIKSLVKIAHTLCKLTVSAKIIHLHYPDHVLVNPAIIFWKILGKKIIVHYHGSDIRNKKARITIPILIQTIYVSTPDLLLHAPRKAVWIPNPYHITELQQETRKNNTNRLNEQKKVKILHAPSNKTVKGTSHIVSVINELISEDYNIELTLLHNVSHEKVLEEIKRTDIIIDQLLLGWYGVFSLEGFEQAKPVCVYISEKLTDKIPRNAYINITKETLKEQLITLIMNSDLRQNVGLNGRRYLEETHDIDKIGQKIMKDLEIPF